MDVNEIVAEIGEDKAVYISDFDAVAEHVSGIVRDGDIVLVLGAGESYKITKKIIEKVESKFGVNV